MAEFTRYGVLLLFECRITKYNPKFRAPNGTYTRREWTAYGDIGRSYDGVKLTHEEYLRVEDAYLDSAIAFLREAQILRLFVRGLENACDNPISIREGEQLTIDQIRIALRHVLREECWCRFEADNGYIHVGWDYYLYLGVPRHCRIARGIAEEKGLFVEEEFQSPYRNQEPGDDES